MCAGLRTVLLLAVALALAAHPLLRSLAMPHLSAGTELGELQVIICTAHGSFAIDEPLGVQAPPKRAHPARGVR